MKTAGYSYFQLKKLFLKEIEARNWTAGQKIPSERDLAVRYQVSRTTVRQAIAELTKEGFLETLPGSGTFVSEGRTSHRPQQKTIAFLVCTRGKPHYTVTTNLFYAQILRGVEQQAREQGYHCIVATVDELSSDDAALESICQKVDGLIIGELHSEKFLQQVEALSIPAVLISPSLASAKIDVLEIANEEGSLQAIRHLAAIGHKKIAYLGGSSHSLPALRRLEGYRKALKEHNLPVHEDLIKICGWDFGNAGHATRELLKTCQFTAIFAASDILAMAAIQELKTAGLCIPDDLSVVGYDDLETSAQTSPALTTVTVYKEFMGRVALKTLLARMDQAADPLTVDPGLRIIVPVTLTKRHSTMAPKS